MRALILTVAMAAILRGQPLTSPEQNYAHTGQFDLSGSRQTKPDRVALLTPSEDSICLNPFETVYAWTGNSRHVCRPSTFAGGSGVWKAIGGAGGGGVTVQANGTTVGTRSIVNYVAGAGLIQTLSDNGTAVTVQQAVDTAIIQTVPAGQSGTSLLCSSAGASATTYTCTMAPVLTAYTTGMIVNWRPDVGATAGAVTLNVDTLGAKAIRRDDGSANPVTGDLVAGRMYRLWYDGTVFRYVAPAASSQTVHLSPGSCPEGAGVGASNGVWFGANALPSCNTTNYFVPVLSFSTGGQGPTSKAHSEFLSANVSFVSNWFTWGQAGPITFTLETRCLALGAVIEPGVSPVTYNSPQSVTISGVTTAWAVGRTTTALTTTGCTIGDVLIVRVNFTALGGSNVYMMNPRLVFN